MSLSNPIKIILLVGIGLGILAVAYYVEIGKGKRAKFNSVSSQPQNQTPDPKPSIHSATPSPLQTSIPLPTLTPTVTQDICPNTVKDIDNNIYKTVQIGSLCWMKENLKVSKNPEGDTITRYCYNNDPKICNTDGGLYGWNTAMNNSTTDGAQGICPDGWHVPKDSEWYILENYLTDPGQTCESTRILAQPNINGIIPEGPDVDCATAGTKLKKGGSSGFDAVLAGFLGTSFWDRGNYSEFWSSTENSNNSAWNRILNAETDIALRSGNTNDIGLSIRCLKN